MRSDIEVNKCFGKGISMTEHLSLSSDDEKRILIHLDTLINNRESDCAFDLIVKIWNDSRISNEELLLHLIMFLRPGDFNDTRRKLQDKLKQLEKK